MKNQFLPILLALFLLNNCTEPKQSEPEESQPKQTELKETKPTGPQPLDVLNYDLTIEPNIKAKSVQGTEIITFLATDSAVFDCGDLIIDKVEGEGILDFEKRKNALKLILAESESPERKVTISYHGNPKQGIQFFPKENQVHTVFFAEQWMICRKQNDDRASIQMKIIAPNSLIAIGNGDFVTKKEIDESRTEFSWHQETPMPSYVFGFAIGDYQVADESKNELSLQYLAHNYSPKDLTTIFKETKGMMDFFEEKSGVPYYQKNYTQILGPQTVSQEMAGFTVVRNLYGKQVLGDSTQINLSAHELAHQWWGNLLTCESWKDFWLNEGMAVFMSSAYKEHRFGKEVYLEDIEVYYQAYKKVKDKNLDKPLKFDNWNNPSPADRTLVYYKGAYFIHLLREKLGEKAFWKGIKMYTQANQAKSVVSKDFQTAMEKASEQDLDAFFQEWIFNK